MGAHPVAMTHFAGVQTHTSPATPASPTPKHTSAAALTGYRATSSAHDGADAYPPPLSLPTQAAFAAAADALGISNDSTVVVYDTQGVFSAPRVWWTFKAFGHDKCAGF